MSHPAALGAGHILDCAVDALGHDSTSAMMRRQAAVVPSAFIFVPNGERSVPKGVEPVYLRCPYKNVYALSTHYCVCIANTDVLTM